jgi:type IV pilus assembly protein PilE
MKLNSREAGVTLIELLVTLVVLGIIVGIGVPMYRQYIQRAHRVDATTALMRLAANQERFYLQNNSYAGDAQLANAMPNGLGIGSTENGYYALSIPDDDNLTVGYTASATVITGAEQGSDKDCWVFSIDEQGTRSAENYDGDDNTAKCWE